MVEWDANAHPLHGRVAAQLPARELGHAQLGGGAGLDFDPGPLIVRRGREGWADLVTWSGEIEGRPATPA